MIGRPRLSRQGAAIGPRYEPKPCFRTINTAVATECSSVRRLVGWKRDEAPRCWQQLATAKLICEDSIGWSVAVGFILMHIAAWAVTVSMLTRLTTSRGPTQFAN